MESNQNFFQKFISLFERSAKTIVILNLIIEIGFFITCCILFILFSTFSFLNCLKILNSQKKNLLVQMFTREFP